MKCTALMTMVLMGMSSSLAYGAADYVFHNGRILTQTAAQPEVEALAVEDQKIIAVGTMKEMQGVIDTDTKMVDLAGQTLMPGFVESHGHVYGLGRKAVTLDLSGTKSLEATLAKVAERVKTLKPGEWLLGRGWDQNLWPEKKFPNKSDLARVSPANPVFLTRVDGHAAWVDPLALQKAGLTTTTPDPAGGRIMRDDKGEPTGILIDEAMGLVEKAIPSTSRQEMKTALEAGMVAAAKAGVTTIHDAGVGAGILSIYRDMAKAGELPVRVYAMLNGSNGKLLKEYFQKGPQNINDMFLVRSVKLMVDGALGSRGAALLEDYADESGNKGLLILNEEQIFSVTKEALAAGYQVAAHAIGDLANQTVLDAYEQALKTQPNKDARLRIEHAQIIAPDDVTRMARLGVIASMQPIHCPSDSPWAIERLGKKRFEERAYVWRDLLNAGVTLAAGSDAPVEPISPILGLHAFLTRQNQAGEPQGGWNPQQKLSLEESLQAYTVSGAYAGFLENKIGALAPGQYADLVILDKDLKKASSKQLLQTQVTMTMVNGKVVYERQVHARR